jgi:sec-independent protein translocase protein TatA
VSSFLSAVAEGRDSLNRPEPPERRIAGASGGRSESLLRFNNRNPSIQGEFMFEGLFQPMHLIMIFGIALLVFGPKKLPELGKGLGDSIRGFKAAMAQPPENKEADKNNTGTAA